MRSAIHQKKKEKEHWLLFHAHTTEKKEEEETEALYILIAGACNCNWPQYARCARALPSPPIRGGRLILSRALAQNVFDVLFLLCAELVRKGNMHVHLQVSVRVRLLLEAI